LVPKISHFLSGNCCWFKPCGSSSDIKPSTPNSGNYFQQPTLELYIYIYTYIYIHAEISQIIIALQSVDIVIVIVIVIIIIILLLLLLLIIIIIIIILILILIILIINIIILLLIIIIIILIIIILIIIIIIINRVSTFVHFWCVHEKTKHTSQFIYHFFDFFGIMLDNGIVTVQRTVDHAGSHSTGFLVSVNSPAKYCD